MSTAGIICGEHVNYADVEEAAIRRGIDASADHLIVLNVAELICLVDHKLGQHEAQLGRKLKSAKEWSEVVLASMGELAARQGFTNTWEVRWIAMPHSLHNMRSKVFTTIWDWATNLPMISAIDLADPQLRRSAA